MLSVSARHQSGRGRRRVKTIGCDRMSDQTQVCKHELTCYYINNSFFGCQKCLAKGKLTNLSRNVKKNHSPTLPSGSSELAMSDGDAELKAQENLINKVIRSNLSGVISDPSIHEGVKEFMQNAQTAVKILAENNKKHVSEKLSFEEKFNLIQEKNAQVVSGLQSQIDELNKRNTSVKDKNGTQFNTGVPKKAIQSKLNFQPAKKGQLNPSNTQLRHKVGGNKFQQLQDEVETDKDGDISSEDDEDSYNSDPEFQSKRKQAHKTARIFKRKREQSNSDSTPENAKVNNQPKESVSRVTSKEGALGENSSYTSKPAKKLLPPPPIKVLGVDDYIKLNNLLLRKEIKKDDFMVRFISTDVWKVNPKTDAVAKLIIETLKEENALNEKVQYYTHVDKNLRDIKVICKGLHPSVPEEDIVEDLKEKGFNVKKATCLMKRVPIEEEKGKKLAKKPGQSTLEEVLVDSNKTADPILETSPMETNLNAASSHSDNGIQTQTQFVEDKDYKAKTKLIKIPVHQLDFDYQEDIEKIYKIKGILSIAVKIEPIKVRTDKIIQCRRCQSFNHSANQCGKQARCVKCAGKHWTADCIFAKRIINPKCANCGVIGHPASYRGCPFAKEMQADRNNLLIKKKKGDTVINSEKFPPLPMKGKGKNKTIAKRTENFAGFHTGQMAQPQKNVSYAEKVSGGNKEPDNEVIKQLLKTIESQRKQIEEMSKRMARFESLFFKTIDNSDDE